MLVLSEEPTATTFTPRPPLRPRRRPRLRAPLAARRPGHFNPPIPIFGPRARLRELDRLPTPRCV